MHHNPNNHNELLCPKCFSNHNTLITTLVADTNVQGKVEAIIVGGKHHIPFVFNYPYENLGNLHILFACENGHFHIKSYDGHKGIIYLDLNNLMYTLGQYLNNKIFKVSYQNQSLDNELLQVITSYFN